MKEGYLQTKINEQKEEIEALKVKIEEHEKVVKDRFDSFDADKFKEELGKHFNENFLALKSSQVQMINDSWNEVFKERANEIMTNLHKRMEKELQLAKDGFKLLTDRYCDEVVLQRKDLSVIMSTLLSKGIVTQEEIKSLDKAMSRQFDNENVKKHIREMFKPRIMKFNDMQEKV